ncbi:class II aldolase/adducin family protein [Streptomyces sp. NPDC048603]|uniref:class II aldolase/adducin family protein n=1 Tax=Streptomyces sp. NPDC048603 TaxID=3365577 RepID=UPI003716659D
MADQIPPEPARPAPLPEERLAFDLPPVFRTAAEEREHRRQRLAGALRVFGRLGYEDGVAGHISARDPEFEDCYWVNPFGRAFAGLTADDLLLVDGDGRVLEGARRVNQAAFAVHAAVHRARPDAVAVVHTPTPHGRALASLGELLAPIGPESCAFYEDHALLDQYTALAGDPEECRRIALALGPRKALILRNRGLLTAGGSVDAAAWWLVAMDRAARVQLLARAAGKPVLVDHRSAVATRERFGTDLAAWVSWQPLLRPADTPADTPVTSTS